METLAESHIERRALATGGRTWTVYGAGEPGEIIIIIIIINEYYVGQNSP